MPRDTPPSGGQGASRGVWCVRSAPRWVVTRVYLPLIRLVGGYVTATTMKVVAQGPMPAWCPLVPVCLSVPHCARSREALYSVCFIGCRIMVEGMNDICKEVNPSFPHLCEIQVFIRENAAMVWKPQAICI